MPTVLVKLWQHRSRLWQRYIWRQTPYALYSWRYCLASKNSALQYQRKFALKVLPELPRAVAAILVLNQLLFWYLWHAPTAVVRVFRFHQATIAQPRLQQIMALLRLAYSRTIHPAAYYQLQLYRYPYSQTFDFVYGQQLPDWHKVWQPELAESVQSLIQDKVLFAQYMSAIGLTTIPTLLTLQRGEVLTALPHNTEPVLFFKPRAASRAEGCFALHLTASDPVIASFTERVCGKDDVIAFINKKISLQQYLVQPLVQHHSELNQFLSEVTPETPVITVRLVTAHCDNTVYFWAANLEVNTGQQRFNVLPIDPETGKLYGDNTLLPHWQTLLDQARKGHSALAAVKTLGWDFIIAENDVYCLEVNLNWGVLAVQSPEQGGLVSKYIATFK